MIQATEHMITHPLLADLSEQYAGRDIIVDFEEFDYEDFAAFWAPIPFEGSSARQNGMYIYVLHLTSDGTYSGQRYTIRFQYRDTDDDNDVELYMLFADPIAGIDQMSLLLNPRVIARSAGFVRAFFDLERAKRHAYTHYNALFGTKPVHIIPFHTPNK